MENTGAKGLAVTLYQRVILSYKSTFLGLLIVAAGVAVEQLQLMPLPAWAKTLLGIVAAALMLIKERKKDSLPKADASATAPTVAVEPSASAADALKEASK